MTYNLQHVIFNQMPIVNQDDSLKLFNQMDEILDFCMNRIVGFRSTVHGLVDIASEIGSSLTHGRLIFNRPAAPVPDDKIKPARAPKNYGSSARLEELLTYNNDCDLESVEFLRKVFKIYNCWTAGFVRHSDVQSLSLCRATYESVISNFLERTKNYPNLCLQSSRLREMMYDATPEEATALSDRQFLIEEELTFIEGDVGCKRSKLFSIRNQVQREMALYSKMKETIYNAYLRIVYKTAREKATAEQQVLENFQNGSIGLLRAISTYNQNRGVFSSYAKTWTLQHILLKLKEDANVIRLPISMWQTNNDLTDIQNRLMVDSNEVNPEMVAEEAGLNTDRVMKVSDYFNNTRVVSMESQNSLDSSSQENKLEDSYDPYEPLPFIDAHVDLLTPRQSFIVFLVYGMYDRLPGDLPSDQRLMADERKKQRSASRTLNSRGKLDC